LSAATCNIRVYSDMCNSHPTATILAG
jgi:hypothetical protein